MGQTFKGMLNMFNMLFKALGHFIGAFNYLGMWSEEVAGGFYDESKGERDTKRIEKEQELLALAKAPSKVKAIANSAAA